MTSSCWGPCVVAGDDVALGIGNFCSARSSGFSWRSWVWADRGHYGRLNHSGLALDSSGDSSRAFAVRNAILPLCWPCGETKCSVFALPCVGRIGRSAQPLQCGYQLWSVDQYHMRDFSMHHNSWWGDVYAVIPPSSPCDPCLPTTPRSPRLSLRNLGQPD